MRYYGFELSIILAHPTDLGVIGTDSYVQKQMPDLKLAMGQRPLSMTVRKSSCEFPSPRHDLGTWHLYQYPHMHMMSIPGIIHAKPTRAACASHATQLKDGAADAPYG